MSTRLAFINSTLSHECALAEQILRDIVHQENLDTDRPLSADESPLKPWIVQSAQTILIWTSVERCFGYASITGHGILIKRYGLLVFDG